MEGAFNKLREGTALGTSGDTKLRKNYWTVKGASLQNILGHRMEFQRKGRVDSEVQGQVIDVQMQMQSLIYQGGKS